MPGPRLQAIVKQHKRRSVADMQRSVTAELRGFAVALKSTMDKYPPQKATVSGYRRTGIYGKGWRFEMEGLDSVVVFNQVRYAKYVGGPSGGGQGQRQTAEMARRDWPAINEVVAKLTKERFPRFAKAIKVTVQ